jgi:hypothetical protein
MLHQLPPSVRVTTANVGPNIVNVLCQDSISSCCCNKPRRPNNRLAVIRENG